MTVRFTLVVELDCDGCRFSENKEFPNDVENTEEALIWCLTVGGWSLDHGDLFCPKCTKKRRAAVEEEAR